MSFRNSAAITAAAFFQWIFGGGEIFGGSGYSTAAGKSIVRRDVTHTTAGKLQHLPLVGYYEFVVLRDYTYTHAGSRAHRAHCMIAGQSPRRRNLELDLEGRDFQMV